MINACCYKSDDKSKKVIYCLIHKKDDMKVIKYIFCQVDNC